MPVPFRAQIVQMSSGAFMSGTIASEWYPTLPSGHSFFLMAASSSVAGGLHTQDGFHYTPVFVTPDYDVLPLWGSKTELSSLDGTSNSTGLARGTSSVNVTLINSATRTVPLPPAAEMRGEPLYFRHQGDGTGTLTIQANGADYLDGVLGGTRIVTHLETVIIIGHVDADGTGRYNTYISDDAFKSLTGPSITTDNAVARWDGTTGSILQNSAVIISDAGDLIVSGTALVNGTTSAGRNAALEIQGTDGSATDGAILTLAGSDGYPGITLWHYQHDVVGLYFDAYYDSGGDKSSDAGSNAAIYKFGDGLVFGYDSGVAQGGVVTWNTSFRVDLDDGRITDFGYHNLSGGRKLSFASATTKPYNLTSAINILGVDTSTYGAVTVNLPTPDITTYQGYTVVIKDTGGVASTSPITIAASVGTTIDGNSSLVVNIDYASITLFCDGSNWFII